MSAFIHGFNHGFSHGMFNGMFGGFGMFNWCNWNFTPTFFSPNYNFGNFFSYQSPMSMMPSFSTPMTQSLFNFSVPNFTATNMNMNWQSINYSVPQFQTDFYVGDTFLRAESQNDDKKKASSSKPSASEDANELKGKHWSEMTDAQLRQVYGDYTRDITKLYTGTAEDLNKYLKGKGVLEGKGQAFIDAQKQHGISAAVLVGIAVNETNHGKDEKARTKHNVGGVRVPGKNEFQTFNSIEDCVMEMARFLKAGYVNNSGRSLKQLYQVNAKYCPASDPTDKSGINGYWARNVDKYAGEVEALV